MEAVDMYLFFQKIFFLLAVLCTSSVHAEEKITAKVGDLVITEKEIWDQVDEYEEKRKAQHGEGLSEKEREHAFFLLRQKELQEKCVIFLMKKEGKWNDKDTKDEKEKKIREFYKKLYSQWEIKMSLEDIQKKAEEISKGEREVYLQLAEFEDKSFIERVKKGLQYANKKTTFESIVKSLMKEEAAKKNEIYKQPMLDLPPKLESSLAKNFPSLAEKDVGEIEIGDVDENGKYFMLYVMKKSKVDPQSKKALINARETLLSDIQDDFFQDLYKKYKVQCFDHNGNPEPFPGDSENSSKKEK